MVVKLKLNSSSNGLPSAAFAALEILMTYLVFLARSLFGLKFKTLVPSQEKSPSTLGLMEKAVCVDTGSMSWRNSILIGLFTKIPEPVGEYDLIPGASIVRKFPDQTSSFSPRFFVSWVS